VGALGGFMLHCTATLPLILIPPEMFMM